MNPAAPELERRLRRLERANSLLALALVVGVVAALVWIWRPRETLRARAVQLVNSEGVVLAEMASREGQAGFFVLDPESKVRLSLFHSADTTGLYVKDAEEVTRIGVAQFAHGGGGVALHGPKSKGAAVLYFKDEGSLRFFDADGTVTNLISATPAEPTR